eukprot:SAG22_NODE_14478_length_373_cov_2.514599_2_plen_80_part_00
MGVRELIILYDRLRYSPVLRESVGIIAGINVSDRALPVVCEVKRTAVTNLGSEQIRYDIFAQTDMIIYLTADGQLSTRI